MAAFRETAAHDDRCAPVASLGYTPRDAAGTVLHQVVREHLETFLATTARAARADPGLPTEGPALIPARSPPQPGGFDFLT